MSYTEDELKAMGATPPVGGDPAAAEAARGRFGAFLAKLTPEERADPLLASRAALAISVSRVVIRLVAMTGETLCQFERAVGGGLPPLERVMRWRGRVFVAAPVASTFVEYREATERVVPDDLGTGGQ